MGLYQDACLPLLSPVYNQDIHIPISKENCFQLNILFSSPAIVQFEIQLTSPINRETMPDTNSSSSNKTCLGIIPTVFLDPRSQPMSSQEASGRASKSHAGAGPADTKSAPAADTTASQPTYEPPTKYRFVKDNWGDRKMFQYSHGLRMEPDDFEEGQIILEGYIESERIEHGDLAWEDRKGTALSLFPFFLV